MSSDVLKCPVCGGTMNRLKTPSVKSGRLVRFKCTCGHCEDLQEEEPSLRKGREVPAVEGFHELP